VNASFIHIFNGGYDVDDESNVIPRHCAHLRVHDAALERIVKAVENDEKSISQVVEEFRLQTVD
jgi:hypothetical protein